MRKILTAFMLILVCFAGAQTVPAHATSPATVSVAQHSELVPDMEAGGLRLGGLNTTTPQEPTPKPNLLLVVSDDQTWSTYNQITMPNTIRFFGDGITDTEAYVNNSLCCPSRATIFSGLYTHHNRVDDNNVKLRKPIFPEALQAAGYTTGLFGKYMNSWPCNDPPAGFDDFVCTVNGHHLDRPFSENGVPLGIQPGSSTAYMVRRALQFMSDTEAQGKPWFVVITPVTPHTPTDDAFERPDVKPDFIPGPAFGIADGLYSFDPPWEGSKFKNKKGAFTKMSQSAAVMDDDLLPLWNAVGSRTDVATIGMWGDNGFLYGEHQLDHKRFEYQESVNVPFTFKWPGHWNTSNTTNALVTNVDFAATLTAAAGTSWPSDGVDLNPLLTGTTTSAHDALLIEACTGAHYPCDVYVPRSGKPDTYIGVVEPVGPHQWKYVEHNERAVPIVTLYDLTADPYELHNVAAENPDEVARLHAELEGMMS